MTDVVSTSVRRKKWREEYWKVKASHIQEGALFSLVSVWQISQEDFKDIIIQELTWKKFYVHLAGCTGGAHLHIVDLLKQLNQSEVFSPEESDDIVVFCPVRSHIRTDISVALETVPALKPTILVVLHHTFDPDSVEADSKRQVCNRLPDLLLTVDCLYNEGKLLSSKHNKAAYMEIIKLIATSYQGYANKPSWRMRPFNYLVKHKGLMTGIAVVIVLVILLIVIVKYTAGKGQTAGGVWKRLNLFQGQKDTGETPDLKKL
ncbi:hypothetical protein D4764_19G0003230 [Takifugu flavidus]|uniref:Uncharacterized protein n=1 Tax=Takifugu flavidus TaxID=433684 RepID=A0A5C6NNQ7_9TELE|nr:hypothetical protein D4764_19G0003230 [Takifugu flavidus]